MSVLHPDNEQGDTNPTSSSSVDLELSELEQRPLESLVAEARLQFDSFTSAVRVISQLPRRDFLKKLAEIAIQYSKNILSIQKAAFKSSEPDKDKKYHADFTISTFLDTDRLQAVLFQAYNCQLKDDGRYSDMEKRLIGAAYNYLALEKRLVSEDREKKLAYNTVKHRAQFLREKKELLESSPEYIFFIHILKEFSTALDKNQILSHIRDFEKRFQINYSAIDGIDEYDTQGYYFIQSADKFSDGVNIRNQIVNAFSYTGRMGGPEGLISNTWK